MGSASHTLDVSGNHRLSILPNDLGRHASILQTSEMNEHARYQRQDKEYYSHNETGSTRAAELDGILCQQCTTESERCRRKAEDQNNSAAKILSAFLFPPGQSLI
jgi:hypothetical protein